MYKFRTGVLSNHTVLLAQGHPARYSTTAVVIENIINLERHFATRVVILVILYTNQ